MTETLAPHAALGSMRGSGAGHARLEARAHRRERRGGLGRAPAEDGGHRTRAATRARETKTKQREGVANDLGSSYVIVFTHSDLDTRRSSVVLFSLICTMSTRAELLFLLLHVRWRRRRTTCPSTQPPCSTTGCSRRGRRRRVATLCIVLSRSATSSEGEVF